MANNQSVSFKKGTSESYENLQSKDANSLYFLTDSLELMVDGKSYGTKYNTKMPDELETPTTIGGLSAGKTAGELKEKSVSELLDTILFPELNPTVTNPSASISLGSGFSNGACYEVGSSAPSTTNLTVTFNQGKGSVAGQADVVRAGTKTGQTLEYTSSGTWTSSLPTEVILGQMQYRATVLHSLGGVLVTSYGNTATKNSAGTTITNPLPAGSVTSNTVSIQGTYPWYATTLGAQTSVGSVTGIVKQPLKTWSSRTTGWPANINQASTNETAGVALLPFNSNSPRKLLLPSKLKVFEQRNDGNGDYEPLDIASMWGTPTVVPINGHDYYLYTYQLTTEVGSNFIKFTLE